MLTSLSFWLGVLVVYLWFAGGIVCLQGAKRQHGSNAVAFNAFVILLWPFVVGAAMLPIRETKATGGKE